MNKLVTLFVKHAPTILTCIGACGVVSSVIEAVHATPKAIKLLEENPPEKPIDYVKTTWKCYIPTAIIAAASIACIFAANGTNRNRQAALAGICAVTEQSARTYKEKVIKKLGAAVDEEIHDEIAKEAINKNPPKKDETLIVFGKDKSLCYDTISGRYFRSSIEDLRRIQNDLNKDIINNCSVSLNELYFALGLPSISLGEALVWTTDDLIDFKFSTQLTEEDEPCIVLDFYTKPIYNFL